MEKNLLDLFNRIENKEGFILLLSEEFNEPIAFIKTWFTPNLLRISKEERLKRSIELAQSTLRNSLTNLTNHERV